jgi:hypothetical protein
MVKVAVAGGTGSTLLSPISTQRLLRMVDVATELLRAPIRSGNHEITISTRSKPANPSPDVAYKIVDYYNRASLTEALSSIDACLSFLVAHLDPECEAQKNLIHPCMH